MNKKDKTAKKMYSKSFNELCDDRKRIVMTMLKVKKLDKEEKQDFIKIPKASFNFCRYSIALIVWISFIFKIKILLVIVFLISIFSAIFTIKRAPLIYIYSNTIGKIFKSKNEFLSIASMRFAHSLCSFISGICVIILYFGNESVAWALVGIFAILKTISAIGLCPASKIYSCATNKNSTCCSFLKKKK